MARKVVTTFIDDLDGSEAERMFPFAVDGVGYEIDLSTENIKGFIAAVDEYVEKARKVGKLSVSSGRSRSTTTSVRPDRQQTAAIREWAAKNGHKVADRGRISAEVMAAFTEAHRSLAAVG